MKKLKKIDLNISKKYININMDPNINFTDKSTPDELRFDLETMKIQVLK